VLTNDQGQRQLCTINSWYYFGTVQVKEVETMNH